EALDAEQPAIVNVAKQGVHHGHHHAAVDVLCRIFPVLIAHSETTVLIDLADAVLPEVRTHPDQRLLAVCQLARGIAYSELCKPELFHQNIQSTLAIAKACNDECLNMQAQLSLAWYHHYHPATRNVEIAGSQYELVVTKARQFGDERLEAVARC